VFENIDDQSRPHEMSYDVAPVNQVRTFAVPPGRPPRDAQGETQSRGVSHHQEQIRAS